MSNMIKRLFTCSVLNTITKIAGWGGIKYGINGSACGSPEKSHKYNVEAIGKTLGVSPGT